MLLLLDEMEKEAQDEPDAEMDQDDASPPEDQTQNTKPDSSKDING
jgi:hypothetical protein